MSNKILVILHCSKSKHGNAALLSKWHTMKPPDGNGWSAIGYHYVILNGWLDSKKYNKYFDGYLETGRALDDDHKLTLDENGAHTKGHNNAIGICLIGESGQFTKKQINCLYEILYQLKDQFFNIEVKQHSDFDSEKPFCAGFFESDMKHFNNVIGSK